MSGVSFGDSCYRKALSILRHCFLLLITHYQDFTNLHYICFVSIFWSVRLSRCYDWKWKTPGLFCLKERGGLCAELTKRLGRSSEKHLRPINRLHPALFQPLWRFWIIKVNRNRFVYFQCKTTGAGWHDEWCAWFLPSSRALLLDVQADRKYWHFFNSQHYFHSEQSRVMKSLCCNETSYGGRFASWKKGRVNAQARFGLCASTPSKANKGPFPTFKRPRFTFIKASTAKSIKHIVLRHQSFVLGKPSRW